MNGWAATRARSLLYQDRSGAESKTLPSNDCESLSSEMSIGRMDGNEMRLSTSRQSASLILIRVRQSQCFSYF